MSALRKSLPLLALFAGAAVMLVSAPTADAEQNGRADSSGQQLQGYSGPPNRGVGGYSLTLRDIWGPAKMPPAPHDFGPHFDYPPEPLNGAPLHDPYPN